MWALILLLQIGRVSDSRSAVGSEFHSFAPPQQKLFFIYSVLGSGNCSEAEEPLCCISLTREKICRQLGAKPLITL